MSLLKKRMFNYIVEYKIANDGISPSIREIKGALDIASTSTVDIYLTKLAEEGKITLGGKQVSRSIKIVGGVYAFNPEELT